MSRTPFIAGNWKMHKTIAEAEAFIQALLPRVSTADGVDVAICVAVHRPAGASSTPRAARACEVYAQNMHQAPTGAFTGEVSAPMLAELDVHGVVLGHSERRQFFDETDRALSEKVPAALDAGLKPILCVGETEDEREAGDTERKLRHQVQEGLEKLDSPRLGDVVIAYEPIWAIGTGLRGDARAGPGGDRLRPRAGGRPRPRAGASARGSSTAARSSPTTRPSCSRCPTSTARWSAAPRSTSPTSRPSSRRRAA